MKMRHLPLLLLSAMLVITSCKKDKTSTPPPPAADPELLGPEAQKVFHYTFNGNLNDTSGNHLNSTNTGNLTFAADRFGRPNHAGNFGAGNSIVLTPSLGTQQIGFPFSISFWFKAGNVSNSQVLIKSDGFERSAYSGFWVQLGITGSGTMSFNIGDGTGSNGSSRNSMISPAIFAANTWYHVVVNVRAANDMDLYVNGVKNLNTTYDGVASSIVYQTGSVGVLGSYGISGTDFVGLLDDYRIYKRILTPAQVSTLYNFTTFP